jgi:hypothetical protein
MKLNLSANNLTTICWWVDASHATHDDCHGHMGAMMSLGKGATISFVNKLKIATKSSTKFELVGTIKHYCPSSTHPASSRHKDILSNKMPSSKITNQPCA